MYVTLGLVIMIECVCTTSSTCTITCAVRWYLSLNVNNSMRIQLHYDVTCSLWARRDKRLGKQWPHMEYISIKFGLLKWKTSALHVQIAQIRLRFQSAIRHMLRYDLINSCRSLCICWILTLLLALRTAAAAEAALRVVTGAVVNTGRLTTSNASILFTNIQPH